MNRFVLIACVQILVFCSIAVAPLAWLRWRAPATLRLIFADLRPERLLHYDAMVLLGAMLHERTSSTAFSLADALALFGLLIALAYAAVFAIISNNIEDLAIDRISNRGRPLASGAIDADRYQRIGRGALLIALALAAIVGRSATLGVAAVSLVYFLYSCRPFRLKRVPIFAKLMIGANSAMLAVAGFVLCGGLWLDFPRPWLLYLVIAVGLAANFIDLKDTEGDAAAGIPTLPVLLGDQGARRAIAIATVFAYASAAWLLGAWSLLPLNFALLLWHLRELRREPFVEARVFRVYLLSQVALIGALWLTARYAVF